MCVAEKKKRELLTPEPKSVHDSFIFMQARGVYCVLYALWLVDCLVPFCVQTILHRVVWFQDRVGVDGERILFQ